MCFTEGWVEFCDKKMAKHVARCLNATQIGEYLVLLVYVLSSYYNVSLCFRVVVSIFCCRW